MKIESYIGEIWKDIPGYEGKYQVSNFGRVRSLDRIDAENHFRKGQIMKVKYTAGPGRGEGYARVALRNGSGQKEYQVHRLVAAAFIPNPDNLPQLNHKDCNPANNHVDNLEWCDAKYNINYADHNKKVSVALSGKKKTYNRKPVKCYNITGEFIKEYECIADAAKETQTQANAITACCKKRKCYYTAGGYRWEYA